MYKIGHLERVKATLSLDSLYLCFSVKTHRVCFLICPVAVTELLCNSISSNADREYFLTEYCEDEITWLTCQDVGKKKKKKRYADNAYSNSYPV